MLIVRRPIEGKRETENCDGASKGICKLSPANLLERFGVSTAFVPQLSIMHIVYFNEI